MISLRRIAGAGTIAPERICEGQQPRTLSCIRNDFVRISGGGAGFDPNFVRSAEKDNETRVENSYGQADNCSINAVRFVRSRR